MFLFLFSKRKRKKIIIVSSNYKMCLILSEISEISWQKVNSFSIAGNLFDGILVKGNTDSLAFLNINFETCYYSLKLIITDYFVISKSYGYGTDYTCTFQQHSFRYEFYEEEITKFSILL